MSDEEIRAAERAYRASGSPADGEAWVQTVLRTTGLPSTFLIARVIETQRGLNTLLAVNELRMPGGVTTAMREAIDRQVTPDDMVSFLRGGREWLEPPAPQFRPISLAEGSRIHVVGSEGQPLGQTIYGAMIDEHNFDCRGPNCDVMVLVGGRGVRCSEYRADPNAHLPRTPGVPAGSAILCNHANENPGHCPCDADCYCRQDGHICSDVTSEPNPFDRECDYCSFEPVWRFRHTTVVPNGHPNGRRVDVVCGSHLASAREERAVFNYDFMNTRAAQQAEEERRLLEQERVAMLNESHLAMDALDIERTMRLMSAAVSVPEHMLREPDSGNVLWHGDGCDTNMQGGMICPKCGIPPSMQDTFLAQATWTPPARCADMACNKRLPAGHTSIYCSNECALNDA